MKDYDNNIELSYLTYWNVNNLCGWTMSQKLPVNRFEWVEDISKFGESFITKKVMKNIFSKLMFNFFFFFFSYFI